MSQDTTQSLWEKRLIGLAICLAGFGAVVFCVWLIWPTYPNDSFGDHFFSKKSLPTVLEVVGAAIGGLLLAINAVFFNKRAVAQEKSAQAQADSVQAATDSVQAQIAANEQDLFKAAIEHLGDKAESVRLGGIYELYGLADSNKEYTERIHKILCAHIRSKTNENDYKKDYQDKPSVEIQDLFTLLTDKSKNDVFRKLRLKIDMNGAYLNGILAQKAQLQGADLRDAQLQGADLLGAQLQGADLSNVELQGVSSTSLDLLLFENRIEKYMGQETELDTVVFAGGITPEEFDRLKKSINLEADYWLLNDYLRYKKNDLQHLLKRLEEQHVGKPAQKGGVKNVRNKYLKDSKMGSYTKEDAEKWIAEYKKATSGEYQAKIPA
jgi:hypothetical protein